MYQPSSYDKLLSIAQLNNILNGITMTESEFNEHVDDTLISIEEAVEESGVDELDFETSNGILTLNFNDGSKIIVNRQTPVQQLWVAARSGGYHFNYDEDAGLWKQDSDKEELFKVLSRLCTEQAEIDVKLY